MNQELIEAQEHQSLNHCQFSSILELQIALPNDNSNSKYLGLSSSGNLGYYIGAKWIKENKIAIVVNPKVKNLDYLKMFMQCFNNPITSNEISRIYEIDLKNPPIKIPSNSFELTPLIIIHFLNLVKTIVRKGLKRDYIWVENNLNSKIKGKILLNQNIKQNTNKTRPDRVYCRYQEYSINCIENKIIKKTLDFILSYLKSHYSKNKELLNLFYFNYSAFHGISSNVEITKVKNLKTNLFYKEYNEALKLAKIILNQFDYSIQNTTQNKENYPPFHIDMSLLFELYTYSELHKVYSKDILFQYHGKYGDIDFININEKTIIDTKYKVIYSQDKYIIDDIRQLSGYSRDINVLKKMGYDLESNLPILDCIIIYPDQNSGKPEIDKLTFKQSKIPQFHNFFKYGIKLPIKPKC